VSSMAHARIASLELVTPAAALPASLSELKAQLRLDGHDQDGKLDADLRAAVAYAEGYTGRQLISAEWTDRLWSFTDPIVLRKAPVISVETITYVDFEGAPQVLATTEWSLEKSREGPGQIHRAYGKFWPSARTQWDAVTIEFTTGYGEAPGDVPFDLRRAVISVAEHFFENPGAVALAERGSMFFEVPMAAKAVLDRYRMRYAA